MVDDAVKGFCHTAHEHGPIRRSLSNVGAISLRGTPGLGSTASTFPTRAVIVLAFCMAVHSYAFVSLFPYVGAMVTELLDLESKNDSGEPHRK